MLDVQNVDVRFTLPNKKELSWFRELWGTRRVTQQSYENQLVDCRNFDEEIEAVMWCHLGSRNEERLCPAKVSLW